MPDALEECRQRSVPLPLFTPTPPTPSTHYPPSFVENTLSCCKNIKKQVENLFYTPPTFNHPPYRTCGKGNILLL